MRSYRIGNNRISTCCTVPRRLGQFPMAAITRERRLRECADRGEPMNQLLQKDQVTPNAEAEFDRYVDSYNSMHAANIKRNGEEPTYFAEYKIKTVARCLSGQKIETIVDFGSGIGASVPFFLDYFPEASLNCLDVSSKSLDFIRGRHGD